MRYTEVIGSVSEHVHAALPLWNKLLALIIQPKATAGISVAQGVARILKYKPQDAYLMPLTANAIS